MTENIENKGDNGHKGHQEHKGNGAGLSEAARQAIIGRIGTVIEGRLVVNDGFGEGIVEAIIDEQSVRGRVKDLGKKTAVGATIHVQVTELLPTSARERFRGSHKYGLWKFLESLVGSETTIIAAVSPAVDFAGFDVLVEGCIWGRAPLKWASYLPKGFKGSTELLVKEAKRPANNNPSRLILAVPKPLLQTVDGNDPDQSQGSNSTPEVTQSDGKVLKVLKELMGVKSAPGPGKPQHPKQTEKHLEETKEFKGLKVFQVLRELETQ